MTRRALALIPSLARAPLFRAVEYASEEEMGSMIGMYRNDLGPRSMAFWRQYAKVQGFKLIENPDLTVMGRN